jgi:transposase-like protein
MTTSADVAGFGARSVPKLRLALVKPFVNNYDYTPTNYLAADETYIKVKGIRHYVRFIIKKSIFGYRVSNTRDVGPCILAMRMAFAKFKIFPGKVLKFIADGYTAYKLAQQQFMLNDPLTGIASALLCLSEEVESIFFYCFLGFSTYQSTILCLPVPFLKNCGFSYVS